MAEESITSIEELSPEVRAYIYQQLSDFTPFLLPDSNMAVEVKELRNADEDGMTYAVVMTLTGGGTYVQSEGDGGDIYEATVKAKENLLRHLHEVMARLNSKKSKAKAKEEESEEESKVLH